MLTPDGHIPFLPIPLPLSRLHSLPSPLCFIRCKGPLSRLIRRLEVHFLQILPFYERVIGRKSRRMKLYRQPCTASVKPQSGSGRERNRKEGKKKQRKIDSDMDKIKLVVYNEYALGYIMPEQPDKVCTLVDRITLGAPFRTMNEPYFIGKRDTVRLAGRKDFDTFRVVFDGYDNPQEYEFDTAQ